MAGAKGGSSDTSADGPEGLGADVEIDRGDVGVVVVEELEDFGAEFDVAPFADRESFVGREIGFEEAREAYGVGARGGGAVGRLLLQRVRRCGFVSFLSCLSRKSCQLGGRRAAVFFGFRRTLRVRTGRFL